MAVTAQVIPLVPAPQSAPAAETNIRYTENPPRSWTAAIREGYRYCGTSTAVDDDGRIEAGVAEFEHPDGRWFGIPCRATRTFGVPLSKSAYRRLTNTRGSRMAREAAKLTRRGRQ